MTTSVIRNAPRISYNPLYLVCNRYVLENGNAKWYLVPVIFAVLKFKLVPGTWYQGGPLFKNDTQTGTGTCFE